MALPVNYPLTVFQLNCHTASVGATPVTAYVYVPFRCKVLKVGSVLGGAITTANATVATTITGTAITGGSITIVQSGSAAGQINTATPTAANIANEGDYISFPSSGASGASIPCTFFAVIQAI